MPFLRDAAYDDLLQDLIDNGEDLYLCSQEPTTFTEAKSTYDLAVKTGISIGAQADASPNGRKVTVAAITGGTIGTSGTATHWAIVDETNDVLIATGALSAPQALVSGNTFSLGAFDIRVPDAVSA